MAEVSANSRRIARNTLLLYGRMLLMMCIGLFTSRIVLQALGVENFGIYGAVGGIVTMSTLLTASISQSISRYLTVELGKGDRQRLKRVFSTAILMQLLFCALVFLLTETIGLWWLECRMNIPEGRMGAARWVLQCSLGTMMLTLLSVPFNAAILAHEKMDAFAWISILEAVLKLGVALLLYLSPFDKLIVYSLLMLATAFFIRLCYGLYCRHTFDECRGKPVFDRPLLREMTGFAGWNVLGSGCYLFNTQGVNQLANIYFGVGINAARSIAAQVENIAKQFVTNFLLALNPQLVKSYAAGQRDYAAQLVEKGVKFTFLIVLLFLLPVGFEAPALLRLWLGAVPPHAATFVRLTLLFLLANMFFNPLLTLIQADGRIKRYYIFSSAILISGFICSWAAYACGAQAYVSYLFCAGAYLVESLYKLLTARRLADFPVGRFCRHTLLPLFVTALLSALPPLLCTLLLPEGLPRTLAVCAASIAAVCFFTWCIALTDGEKAFLRDKIRRHA
ncbi:MAG: hypothetical protein IKS68_00180, partial [Mailhella sp.]|nr:hypothetical protein [Mailhella sp.]